MNRDVVVATMVLVLCGAGASLASWIPARGATTPRAVSAREIERDLWRHLWLPLLPAALALGTLVGWRLQEPSVTDEPLRPIVALVALPFGLFWTRALARAFLALRRPRTMPPIATVGLVRPWIEVAADVDQLLDPDALAAALAHERAHVRHRDPFRIWLAQIATDLQGLGPFARRRLDAWLESLEIARDEDARSEGVRGEDLAAAVLAVAKMSAPATGAVAGLTGTQASLASRVRRLLDPLPVLYRRRSVVLPLMILIALGVSIGVGVRCGDSVLRALPFIGA